MDTIYMHGYEILETLYENRDIIVCRVRNRQGQLFIVKTMKKNTPTEEQLAQLEYEYRFVNQLEGQGMIRTHELIKHYKGHLIVMENIDGMPMLDAPIFQTIQQGDQTLTANMLIAICKIFIAMAQAIDNIHEKQIIHKEITPNLFLVASDLSEVKILNISFAKKGKNSTNKLDYSQEIDPFLHYISPEQTGRTGRTIDYRTDFYSLGASMYNLLTGQRPFASNHMMELIHQHIATMPRAPQLINGHIPQSLSDIIMKLMAKEPEQRYQSTTGIVYDLKKCIVSLQVSGVIEPFEIGTHDGSNKFQIPQKLYGREREKGVLQQVYEQGVEGGSQLLFVTGSAGVGKTSIIQEMYRPLAASGGFFVYSKAEQLQINTPYYVFTQVAKQLIRTLLQQPDFILQQWKEQLLHALGQHGQLIVDLVPELKLIVERQPKVEELEPTESRNRFFHTFANFFRVFIQKTRPLTIFLDDLQWCDPSSMEFMKYLLSSDDIHHFIMISCYRDNEVIESHPLYLSFHELRQLNHTTVLNIQPLTEDVLADMLVDTVHCTIEKARPLAKIIYKKTIGNPFFVRSVLLHLYHQQLIRFHEQLQQWEWDNQTIQGIDISDNIIDFLTEQIVKLPIQTQRLLQVASLVGATFDVQLLHAVEQMDAFDVMVYLKEAVDHEIIILESDYDDIVIAMNLQDSHVHFRFIHDRVQQACASLMQEQQRQQLHVKIGMTMKQTLSENTLMDQAMPIVSHLNEGLDEIQNIEERFDTAQLNLWACQKALEATSFQLALQFITNGIHVLPSNAWEQHYTLTFELFKICAESAYLNNEYILAEQYIEHLMQHAKTPLEQAEIRLMQSILYRYSGQLDNVIHYGILALNLLKVRISAKPSWYYVVQELLIDKMKLFGKSTQQLLNAPPMENQRMKLMTRILGELSSVSYNAGDVTLFLLATLKGLNITLRYGNSREAASIYSGYAVLLAVLGDLKGSYEFHQLALQLVQSEERAKYRASVLFAYGFLGHAWKDSWQTVDQCFKQAMEEAIKYGDHYQISLAGTFMYAFKADMNLMSLIEKAMEQVQIIHRINNKYGKYMSFLFIHRYLNYAGLTDGQFTLDVSQKTYDTNGGVGVLCSEEECLESFRQMNSLSGIGVYYKEKMFLHYIYDDYEGAMRWLHELDKYMKYHAGTPYIVECRVANFLVLAANLPTMDAKKVKKTRQRLKKEYRYVKKWANYSPVNFLHLQYILEAELKRIDGNIYEAAECYDLAIQTARNNGFIRDQALANELAAKMFLAHNRTSQAAFYMSASYHLYETWGAQAKVKHMAEQYAHLLKQSNSLQKQLAVYETIETEDIDLLSIMHAYRTVSTETQLPALLRQIMKIVVENSGAQKAYILLKNAHGWEIEAEWLQGEDMNVLHAIPLQQAQQMLAVSVVNFCIRAEEYVVLSDAAKHESFFNDPYIQKNDTKSLLCMPIMNQGVLTGVLYIENNLLVDAFTNNHIQILQLLAAQFSISIKNIQLFTNLMETTEQLHQSSEELLRSEIAFLQAQIKPHFLYNAINTISAFSFDDPQMTRELLANLSQYLRSSFDFKNRDKLVNLRQELALVEAYLFIEKARFGDRIRVIYDIEDGIECMLPPIIIQPLVENAVQHGLSSRKQGGTIHMTIRQEHDHMYICVEDDGVGMPADVQQNILAQQGSGVALKNIHLRLTQLYGHGLDIKTSEGGGTKIMMRIPR